MKTTIKNGLIATLFLLTAMTQTQSTQAQVADQWANTLRFAGNWKGDATLTLGDQTFAVVYHTKFKTALHGSAMTMDEWFNDPALGSFEGANLIGLSATDGMVHWFSADNFGTAHEHTGSWLDDYHFYMEHTSIQGGQTFLEKIDFILDAGNQKMEVKLEATLDGVIVQAIEGILVRSMQP